MWTGDQCLSTLNTDGHIDMSMLIHTYINTFLNKVKNEYFLQLNKSNLDGKLTALFKSAFKPHTPPLFGILTLCAHTHTRWDSEVQIIQSNVHVDRVQLIRVHLLGGWQPSGHSWILRLAQRGVKDYWLLDKENREICRIVTKIIGLNKQISMLNVLSEQWSPWNTSFVDCLCHWRIICLDSRFYG